MIGVVTAYTKQYFNPYQLAEINRTIELYQMKCQYGYQDAYMTTFGGLNHLDFRGKHICKELVQELYAAVEPLSRFVGELPFVVAHTGIKHYFGGFHRPIRLRWEEECEEKVVKGYEEIMNIAREGKKALLNQDWEQLAYLMNENHRIQDGIYDSGEVNNHMIKVAKDNGALDAKLAGAGGGGTIIALTFDPEATKKALEDAGAEAFLELDPTAQGITVETLAPGLQEVAVSQE